jgi:hypothetical protein
MRRFLRHTLVVVGTGTLCLYGHARFLSWQVHNLLVQQEATFTGESFSIAPNGVTTLHFKEIRKHPVTLQDIKISQPFWALHSAHIMIQTLNITNPHLNLTTQEVEGKCRWQSNQLILHYQAKEGHIRTSKDSEVPFHSEGIIHLLPHHTTVFEQVKLTSQDINLHAEGQLDWHSKDGLLTLTINGYERAVALLAKLNIISDTQAKWGRLGNKIANFFSKAEDESQTTINLSFSQGIARWGPVTLGHF